MGSKKTKTVRLDKVKPELVECYCARFDVPQDSAAEVGVRVAALAEAFREQARVGTIAADDIVQCDVCFGFSPNTLDECPFCGERDEQPEAEPKPDAIVQTNSKSVKAKKAAQAQAEPTEVHDADGVIVHTIIVTEHDLDLAVERIERIRTELMRTGSRCGWEMGTELREIHAKKLYLQRLDAKTKVPKYKAFSQFVTHEVKITPRYAFELMDIAAAFDKQTIEQVAMRKLRTILQVPDEYRAELKERALAGASTNELAQAVSQVMEGRPLRDTGRAGFRAGTTKVDPRAAKEEKKKKETAAKEAKKKKTDAAAAKGTKDRPVDAVTVLMARRTKVKLFKAKQDKTGNKLRAMRVTDDPCGTIDLWNNTKLHVRVITNAKKELEVVIDIERPNASS